VHSQSRANPEIPFLLAASSLRWLFCSVLRFLRPHLGLQRYIFLRQRVSRRGHALQIVAHLTVLFLQVRHLRFQLLVLLQGLGVLAGRQGQTQRYGKGKPRPRVPTRHSSSFLLFFAHWIGNAITATEAGEVGSLRRPFQPNGVSAQAQA